MVRKEKKSLKTLREERNMTQKELATIMQCTQTTVSYWENGKKTPTLPKLLLLSTIFNTPIENFKFGN